MRIDLRSDTVTQPSAAMRTAMSQAPLGDDVFGDDPTVNRLQDVAAERFGMQAGLFFPSGTQSNLAALMAPVTPGEVLVRAKAVKGRASYEWQYSIDGGKTWLAMGTTTVANTSLPGMTAGAALMFRFRTTVKKTTSDWSATVSFTVT